MFNNIGDRCKMAHTITKITVMSNSKRWIFKPRPTKEYNITQKIKKLIKLDISWRVHNKTQQMERII